MLRNSGIISIVLFASQLLAIVPQCFGHKNTTWMCKNTDQLAFRVSDDRGVCHCLFVSQFEERHLGEGYREKQGVGIYKFHKVGKTWNEARKICHNEGAHLAVINSKEELQALNQIFADEYSGIRDADRTDLAYLGVHTHFGAGAWTTVIPGKGEWIKPNDFIPWNRLKNGEKCEGKWGDQPYNWDGKQNCGALIRPCKTMDDHDCDKRFAFFCEKPKLCP